MSNKKILKCHKCNQQFYFPVARKDNRCPHCGEPIRAEKP